MNGRRSNIPEVYFFLARGEIIAREDDYQLIEWVSQHFKDVSLNA